MWNRAEPRAQSVCFTRLGDWGRSLSTKPLLDCGGSTYRLAPFASWTFADRAKVKKGILPVLMKTRAKRTQLKTYCGLSARCSSLASGAVEAGGFTAAVVVGVEAMAACSLDRTLGSLT